MIKIKKLSLMNKNFVYKLFFSFIVFSILLLASIIFIHVSFTQQQKYETFKAETSLQYEEKKLFLENFLQKRKDSLLAISNNPYFREYVASELYVHNTDFLFYTIMEENKDYMQFRYINEKGMEALRFDRRGYGQTAFKVGQLQNKSNRYYYQETAKMRLGEVFYSKLDLNMENGKIQEPHIHVLRVATPVYIRNTYKGVLIVNIFMEQFLKVFQLSPIFDIYLLNNNGQFVEEGIYFDKKTMEKILDTHDEMIISEKNLYVKRLNIGNQSLLLLYKSKTEMLKKHRQNDTKMAILILLFAILISIPFAYLMSRPTKLAFDEMIKEGDKLHDLALNLDKKIEEETLKNAKKDRLLQHQSKMAELGDMIGNIAHQWRHPLTRLSLILQNMNAYRKKDKLNDKIFDKSMEDSLEQILFMSDTIENFKDFYRTDKKQSQFFISQVIDKIDKIIGIGLRHDNITFILNDPQAVQIKGIKNELVQVLLNLIVNAKDALKENKIHDAYIHVDIAQIQESIQIEVKDNAGGIPQEIMQEIFNPYFTTKEEKGTGIGLYLSKTIIEESFNGKLLVNNDHNGATFTILLPI
ncbi:MAG: ATP-binding protein [Campylobacterota bacterium]|nr:ATP-binding protein [Campylobacterota bacterium]